jgi:hypothetical protein
VVVAAGKTAAIANLVGNPITNHANCPTTWVGKLGNSLKKVTGVKNDGTGAKAPRTPTARAATTDVDSAEHKQLPKRRSSIKQTTLMWIWQLLLKYL